MSLAFLFYFQNDGDTPPIPPTPPPTADIGPGDYSTTLKEFNLPGEVKPKRKRLSKAIVKKAKKLAKETPTIESVTEFSKAAIPQASPIDISYIAINILRQLEASLQAMARAAQIEAAQIAEQQAQELRQRILIEEIARYMQALEDDEMLLAYML